MNRFKKLHIKWLRARIESLNDSMALCRYINDASHTFMYRHSEEYARYTDKRNELVKKLERKTTS